MNIDELTIGQLKSLRALLGETQGNDDSHWQVGYNYFIRTVTHHLLGKLVKVTPTELVLVDAAWIADDGRYHEFLKSGNANEIEPYPEGTQVIIGRGALIDACRWPHPLLREVK